MESYYHSAEQWPTCVLCVLCYIVHAMDPCTVSCEVHTHMCFGWSRLLNATSVEYVTQYNLPLIHNTASLPHSICTNPLTLYSAVDSKPDIAMDAVMQLMDRLSPEQQHECLQLLSSRGLSQKQF